MENENEVFLLTQEETEALVKKGYNEALMWAVEAIKRFPEQSPEEIIRTVHAAVSSNLNSTNVNPIFVETIEPVNLAEFSFKVLNGETVETVFEEENETVENFTSIYDELAARSTETEAVHEQITDESNVPDETYSESSSIFDMLAAQSGIFGTKEDEKIETIVETEAYDKAEEEIDNFEPVLEDFAGQDIVDDETINSEENNVEVSEEENNVEVSEEEHLSEDDATYDEENNGNSYASLEEEYINAAVESTDNIEPINVEQSLEEETPSFHESPEEETSEEATEEVVEEASEEVVEEASEEVEEEVEEESEVSIFDQLAAQTGLIMTDETPSEEDVSAEETTEDVIELSNEDPEYTNIVEASEEVVEEATEEVEEESEVSIFDQLATQTGLIMTDETPSEEDNQIEQSVSEAEEEAISEPTTEMETETFEEETTENVQTSFNEEVPVVEQDEEFADSFKSEAGTEETIEHQAEITSTADANDYEFNMDIAEQDNSFETLTDEEIEQGTAEKLTVKNVNINRYVYENLEGEDEEETSEEYDNGISIEKAYSAEESGGIINNTLLVQEFDADKKLVSRDVNAETQIEFVNKEYEPGEEYTIITETVIQKDEMENPETAKEFGGNVNISLGGGYEAPDEEASEIIPEPEVKVDVAEQISDGKPKKRKKLFGKDEDETPQYETETFIPVIEIDEEELAAQASSEGLSREGRNIGLAGLGGGGIEIADEVYDKPLTRSEQSVSNDSYMPTVEEEPENIPTLEEEPEEETPKMVNPNVNTRQLIKDVKIIDSF